MATLRSLRSFFDSTPPDLLDTALPSLLLLSRASHEQTQAELATLRSQLAEKESMLSSIFLRQQQQRSGGEDGNEQLGASIEFGVQEAQIEALERKNEDLADQNRKVVLALETAEAKGRALMAEVKNMRDRWQGPAATAAREEQEKKYQALEALHKATASELDARKADNERLVLERNTNTARIRALESGGAATAGDTVGDTVDGDLRAENEMLLARLKSLETASASQNKTISVLKTVVKTNEQSNVDLQKKNLDLVTEINTLEAQYERAQKKNIVLESKYSELEDEKLALEVKLGNNRVGTVRTDTEDKRRLEERISQLEGTTKQLEVKNKYLQENNKHLADTNIKLLDAKKAAEAKQQQLHDDKMALDADLATVCTKLQQLERAGASVHRADLESTNKKLVDENNYLARKKERQSQRIQDLENEITTLKERSKRMLSEIHTLRDEKNRLNRDLDDLVRQQRIDRRASIDRGRDQVPVPPHTTKDVNGNTNGQPAKPQESSASPIMANRGTKRPADDQEDPANSASSSSGRSNYTIRAIADTSQTTPAPAQPSPPPVTGQRSLFDRVKPPTPLTEARSLFDRINAPSPPSRPQLDREIDELIQTTQDHKRGVFCRFHGFQPKVAELLDLICAGPLESVRMALEKDVAFLWFLRPRDAAAFMAHARAHLNGGKVTIPHPGGKTPSPVEFTWNEKPTRALDKDIATHVIRYGASRAFIIHCVPYDVSLQKIVSDVGGKRFGFWLCEGATGKVARDGRTAGREVVVEFTNVRDAIECRKRLGQDFWCEASWVKEGCDRAVPGSVQAGATAATGAGAAVGAAAAGGSGGGGGR